MPDRVANENENTWTWSVRVEINPEDLANGNVIRLDAEVEAKSINYEDCKLKNGNICLEEKKKSSSPNFKISAAAYIVLITLYVCL